MISATIKDLKDVVAMISFYSHLCVLFCLCRTDESWRIAVDYCKYNQIVTLVTAAVPDMLSLIKQINIASIS